MTAAIVVFASTLGKIFEPVFRAMAWLIAFFYALIPNYAIAIALLTVVVMIVTAPLTIKSTRSMLAMQKLAPEVKKLQQKYKGDRQKLNEEMMNLYREHGANPAGGCLPLAIQMPVFIVLYDVIKGLTNTVKRGQQITSLEPVHVVCHHVTCADPRYIAPHTLLYRNLVKDHGTMPAFGIDLAQKALGHHSLVAALPYIFLVLIAIGLQYLQMRQLNSRNPAMAQANPQAQMMQRYMPIIFAVIYINIAAGVNIYFIVSSLCRMGLQEFTFRSAARDEAKRPAEARVSGTSPPKKKGLMDRLAEAQKRAVEAQQARQAALQPGEDSGQQGNGSSKPGSAGASAQGGKSGPANGSRQSGKPSGSGRPAPRNGSRRQAQGGDRTASDKGPSPSGTQNKSKQSGPSGASPGQTGSGEGQEASAAGTDGGGSPSPSKAKRTRKAR